MNKTIIFASALTLLFSACEMKDELLSKDSESNMSGSLALNVNAEAPASLTRTAVETGNFEVSVAGQGNLSELVYNYDAVSNMPERITLPVGSYTVTAHTPGTLERQMANPYYRGTADVDIEANITSNKEVACTMANSRVSISYSQEFLNTFATWTITVNDGTDQVLVYTNEDTDPADIYWYFENNTKSITVDIRATTKNGGNVTASATYNKNNCEEGYNNIENENFTGGDAISINFSPIEDANTTGKITGIGINATVTFENFDETVTIHVKDVTGEGSEEGGDEPNTPAEPTDPIVISEPNGTNYLETGVTYTQYWEEADDAGVPYYLNCPDDVALHFDVAAGLEHLYVLISGSEDFEFMTGLLGLTAAPYGLDLTDSSDENTATIADMDLFTMPEKGAKTYDFAFSEGIWRLLPSFVGEQRFTLRAVDAEGNFLEKTLTVTINEME